MVCAGVGGSKGRESSKTRGAFVRQAPPIRRAEHKRPGGPRLPPHHAASLARRRRVPNIKTIRPGGRHRDPTSASRNTKEQVVGVGWLGGLGMHVMCTQAGIF